MTSARSFRLLIAACALLPVGVPIARAEDFPTKPVALINPFVPGGASDLTARAVIATATTHLGQPIVLHSKPGGGGAIASEAVAQAKPDGYTLLLGHTNCNTILPAVDGRSKGPDAYASVALLNVVDGLFLALPAAPFKTFTEMIAWAKANPGKLTFGSIGTWSASDFMWKHLESQFGLKTRLVSHNGAGEALVALLGGHVQVSILTPTQTLPHIKAGRVRPLAVAGARRHPELPDLPSAREEGFDSNVSIWIGVMAPKGTPRPIIEKLAAAFKKMTEEPQAIAMMRQLGDQFDYMGPDEFTRFWRAEYETYRELGLLFKK